MIRVLAIVAIAAGCSPREAPDQPLPFSHAVHAGKHEIACTQCHAGAERGAQAGLPAISVCMSCHMKPLGDPPSEKEAKVREVAAKGGPFNWIQVTRNEAHVYFSHRAHTTFAKMPCSDCHGAVEQWAEAPKLPNPDLVDMAACMDCHRERGTSNECKVCHR